MPIRFEWDPSKDRRNRRKHRIGFDEASTVFQDALSISIPDPDSEDEERWVILGMSHRHRVLVVVHTERDEGQSIRIISARQADPGERRSYEEGQPRKR